MLDDSQMQPQDLEDLRFLPDIMVPPQHSGDPFACPCCANVFAETLRLASIDLSKHARRLPKSPFPTQSAPLLIENARVVTMDANKPAADTLLVQDGRIAWVGMAKDQPQGLLDNEADLQRINLQGKTVLPGFVEPHMHLPPLAMLHRFSNIGPNRFATTEEALAQLRDDAAQVEAGEWVVGRQFDPSLQEGPDYLTKDLLDTVSTEHPVFVYNASLHLAYCNSLALDIAGIDANTEDPPNAELGRTESGEPNGVLKAGPAMALVARHNPKLREQNLAEACLGVFNTANRVGITMLCDQGTGTFQGVGELALYQSLKDSGQMTARFRYSVSQAAASKWDDAEIEWGEGDEWVRRTGWKIVSDGSNQGRTGLQRESFVGSDSTGMAYIEKDELDAAVEKRLRDGWAVCVHANGDAAIDRVLDAFAKAKAKGLDPAEKRCRIEHCSILHDEQITKMQELGLSPSFLIGHVHYWGKAFVEDIFGPEKAAKLDRTGACEDLGIRWTVHSDDPVTEMNPLRCIENAVTRNMWRSDQLLSPEERVPVEAALRAMTIDAAWQCHSDHEVGSLEVGKFADFVVLAEDPLAVEPERLAQIQVLETWVGGRQVYSVA
ncbi:MAG: amidohydrolase family protein [Pseudomonadota bacterium]|nr:amidohydrolase family protein [Pseudomonadota bacterium]